VIVRVSSRQRIIQKQKKSIRALPSAYTVQALSNLRTAHVLNTEHLVINFHVHTVHLDNYQSFFPQTDAQLDSLKNSFKIDIEKLFNVNFNANLKLFLTQ